jgi:hypothetical protein
MLNAGDSIKLKINVTSEPIVEGHNYLESLENLPHALQRKRQAGLAVTGWKSRGRLAAPVAEIRDVKYHRSRASRFGPDEHL